MTKLALSEAWSRRIKLRAEGGKLRVEGYKLRAEGNKLRAEGDKLCAEGDKLCTEGGKLRAEGGKLWAEGAKLWAGAIIELYGNVTLSWSWKTEHGECTLENGDVYGAEKQECEAV
jgi:hypothetical protein